MFTIKKTTEMFFFHIKIWMSHPEKFTPPCYLANCRFLRIVHGTKIVQNQKTISGKKMTFIIGSLSHSEKATSSCFLANYWLLRIEKNDLHYRMYESSRKRYINMLSRKLSSFETWLWRQKVFRIKKQLRKLSSS